MRLQLDRENANQERVARELLSLELEFSSSGGPGTDAALKAALRNLEVQVETGTLRLPRLSEREASLLRGPLAMLLAFAQSGHLNLGSSDTFSRLMSGKWDRKFNITNHAQIEIPSLRTRVIIDPEDERLVIESALSQENDAQYITWVKRPEAVFAFQAILQRGEATSHELALILEDHRRNGSEEILQALTLSALAQDVSQILSDLPARAGELPEKMNELRKFLLQQVLR